MPLPLPKILALALLPLLLAAACAAGPTAPSLPEADSPGAAPAAAENIPRPTAAPDPAAAARAFWNCIEDRRARWGELNRYQRFLSSEIGAAQEAAQACAAAQLPPWNPGTHPPNDGADVAQCLDREHRRYQGLGFPRNPPAGAASFADQGLTKICYIGERITEFGFSEEFLRQRQRIHNGG